MNFSEVFVIVPDRERHCSIHSIDDRIYTDRAEAEVVANNINRNQAKGWSVRVLSLSEYDEERYSYGYSEGYDSGNNDGDIETRRSLGYC